MWAQLRYRRGRTGATAAGIVVASLSFALLTGVVSSSQLQIHGRVRSNFRAAYDILIRPTGSRTPLETSSGLVQPDYLGGLFGGISLAQYHRIQAVPGVEVAAPIANLGYVLQPAFVVVDLTGLLSGAPRQLFRVHPVFHADTGLSAYPDGDAYIYFTHSSLQYQSSGADSERDPRTGKADRVCAAFYDAAPTSASPFSLSSQDRGGLDCFYAGEPPGYSGDLRLPNGHVGTRILFSFPFLLAAIDPVQEARLVGLKQAVVAGRYLRPGEGATVEGPADAPFRVVPVIAAAASATGEALTLNVQRLRIPDPAGLPAALAAPTVRRFLGGLPGATVATRTVPAQTAYTQLLGDAAQSPPAQGGVNEYWTTSPVRYRRVGRKELVPVGVVNPVSVWASNLSMSGYALVPVDNGDTQFRRLHEHEVSGAVVDNVSNGASAQLVGRFDAKRLPGYSPLSQVPLTTYYPPQASAADSATARRLRGQTLRPSANLGGYLSQPPLLLTTLSALSALTSRQYYSNTHAAAPISAIRVRVAGVTGPDRLSQARIRAAAAAIIAATGLDVDVTIGSSPTAVTVDLPAGRSGRPALRLREGWSQKGASLAILSAVDRTSLGLFVLVLVVCGFFLLNATLAAVRSRRAELGVLACLGWSRRSILVLLEGELLLTGVVAGLAGTALAAALSALFTLHVTGTHLLLITPVAALLAVLSGLVPAVQAARVTPLAASRPPVSRPRRARRVNSIGGLALVGIRRLPGRTMLGALSLLVGVAALSVLVALGVAFHHEVVGTLLGQAITVQIRGVDYVAAGLTVVLGGFAVADVTYLNITERVAEIGILRSAGWADRHVRRLFGIEGLATAALGITAGTVMGVVVAAVLLSAPVGAALIGAAAAAAAGLVMAALALLLPLGRLTQLAPASAVAED